MDKERYLESVRKNVEVYHQSVMADRYRISAVRWIGASKKAMLLGDANIMRYGLPYSDLVDLIPHMVNLNLRGENIYVTPISDKYHYAIVDDMSSEAVLKIVKDEGYRPTIILKTSPANYQMVIPVAKFDDIDDDYNRRIGNAAVRYLNASFGDPKFTGVIHPHRLPGFFNRKNKYKDSNGNYPIVSIIKSWDFRPCERLHKLAFEIRQKMDEEKNQVNHDVETQKKVEEYLKDNKVYTLSESGDSEKLLAIYEAHRRNIMAIINRDRYDESRIDSMIALRMRLTGHPIGDIYQAIYLGARRDNRHHSWSDYAWRTARWAYSPDADKQVDRLGQYVEDWEVLERNVLEHLENPKSVENQGVSPSLC